MTTIRNEVKTPFGTVIITEPDFRETTEYSIPDHGATRGDKNKISAAICQAIDAAHDNGGGKVLIPEGEWLTKKIYFKSNVNLHLEKGGDIAFF